MKDKPTENRKEYLEKKKEVMEKIQEEEFNIKNKRIIRITKDMKQKNGNINGAAFWEANKKLTQRKVEVGSKAINNKKGKRIEKDQEIKEVYKDFYKELLTPKPPETEVEKGQEEKINKTLQEITQKAKEQQPMEIIEGKLDKVVKKLKKNKAPDSEEIKN